MYQVSRELIRRGHQVTIVTEKFDKDSAEYQKVEGMEVYRIPVGKNAWLKKFSIWLWVMRQRKLIAKADIIHCHDVFFWYLPFRFIFIFKKVYTTFHGYEGNDIPGKKAIFMHKMAERLSNGIICVGKFQEKWYGTKADFVTFGAVAQQDDRVSFRKIQRPDRVYAVFVGRLEEETGIMVYLRALAIVKARGFSIHVGILGDGTLRTEAEKFCKVHDLSVWFRGFVNDVEKYMSDVNFVFTSRYLGILEAMVMKRFVFAVYNNAIKEDYLRMSPFAESISITKDDHTLAEEIAFHIQNQHVTFRKANAGYAFAKNQSWDSLVDIYLRLWGNKRMGGKRIIFFERK